MQESSEASSQEITGVLIPSDWPEFPIICAMLEARNNGEPYEIMRLQKEVAFLTHMQLETREVLLKQIKDLENELNTLRASN